MYQCVQRRRCALFQVAKRVITYIIFQLASQQFSLDVNPVGLHVLSSCCHVAFVLQAMGIPALALLKAVLHSVFAGDCLCDEYR